MSILPTIFGIYHCGSSIQAKGWRKRVHESIKDFSPDTKDGVPEMMDSVEGKRSEELLGHDKAESMMKKDNQRRSII